MNRLDLGIEENKEILRQIQKFCQDNSNKINTYLMVFRDEDGISLHPRISRPCYGEMRAYKGKSKNRQEDRFPSDLNNDFPSGTPIGVALPFGKGDIFKNVSQFKKNLFGPANPWLGKNKEFTDNVVFLTTEEQVDGVFVNTGDIPPTFLVATMMLQRNINKVNIDFFDYLIKNNVPEIDAKILSLIGTKPNNVIGMYSSAVFSPYTKLMDVLAQEPRDLDGGLLWSDRADYNRPEIANAFPMHKTALASQHWDMKTYNSGEEFLKRFGYMRIEEVA